MTSDPKDVIKDKITELTAKIAIGEKALASMRESVEKYKTALEVLEGIDLKTSLSAIRIQEPIRTTANVRQNERNLTSLEDEIAADLPKLVETDPKGATIAQIVQWLGATDYDVRYAVNALVLKERIVKYRRRDSSANRYIPVGYVPPPEELTTAQARFMDYLAKHADENGICRVSMNEIAKHASISKGTIVHVRDALELRNRIKTIERGNGVTPNTMQIISAVPDGGSHKPQYEEFEDA